MPRTRKEYGASCCLPSTPYVMYDVGMTQTSKRIELSKTQRSTLAHIAELGGSVQGGVMQAGIHLNALQPLTAKGMLTRETNQFRQSTYIITDAGRANI